MPKLIATESLRVYAGKQLTAGDEFEADEKDAHVLKVGGFATEPEAAKEPRGKYRRKDMRAER